MADYRLAASVISRSTGRSATAAAAYRAGCVIADERTGEVHDYTRKGGVEWTGIEAPDGAPAWTQDREQLWNKVEAAETRKNSQVAREIQVSLPHELSFEQRKALVTEFVQKEFVARGMVADIAMHKPDSRGDQRNFHAHIMLTVRGLDANQQNGFARTKERDWNTTETLEGWRKSWAEVQNKHLKQHLGKDAPRVDHRSYAERGVEKVPGRHLGPDATAMERRGAKSEKGAYNRSVNNRNKHIEQARARQKEIQAQQPAISGYGRLHNRALIERDNFVKAAGKASRELREIREQQAALPGLKGLNNSLQREVLADVQQSLKTAKRDQQAVRRELARFEDRAKSINGRAANLAGWINNPRRMLALKRAQINERTKILKDLNDRAKTVVRLQAEVAVRKDWLKSDQGKAWKADKTTQVRELRTAERKARRNVAQAERNVKRAEMLSEVCYHLNHLAKRYDVPAIEIPQDALNRERAFRQMSRDVQGAVRSLPPQARQELAQAVQRGRDHGHSR